ncbi:type IV pilus twitching motility protein PilT [Alkalibacterium putridalgicola]|uniref:type IV pilus twitching motility protein PilT n=1 Tax=Alkalibacterium putridalgicola TaxID=426703 RepID=UPI0034CD85B0
MERLNKILTTAFYKDASDIHFTAGVPPVFRINGKLTMEKSEKLMPDDTEEMARSILSDQVWEKFQKEREVDLSYGISGLSRFRVNIYYQRGAVAMAFRVIARDIPTIDQLKIPQKLKELVGKPYGLLLVTGPTGSGKSTSLASMINYMNMEMNRHIITLEDPIEYLHSHNKSVIDQREIGFDTRSFKDGLRASLRQDPDVILVGELRDMDTIQTAITAAETGHLVMGTLHTQDTTGTIDRIIDVFPAEQKDQIRTILASVLIGVMSQRLFPTLDQQGRVAATELLVNNSAIKNLIRSEKMHQIPNVLQTAKDQGMHTMEMSMKRLIQEGKISQLEMKAYFDK